MYNFNINIFLNNIDTLLIEKNITKSQFYKEIGISSGSFSDWKAGRSKPSGKTLTKLANYFECSIDGLLTDKINDNLFDENPNSTTKLIISEKENLLLSNFKKLNSLGQEKALERVEELTQIFTYTVKEKSSLKIENLKQVKFYEIPASAGIGSLITEDVPFEIKEIDLITIPHARKADFALYVRGDSMEPNFYDGDVVFIKEQPYIEEGQIGIFIYENESYIKKYTTDKKGQVYLVSLNPKYEPIKISENNCFKICGVVL